MKLPFNKEEKRREKRERAGNGIFSTNLDL